MSLLSEEEQRVWRYLVANPTADATDVALNCDVDIKLAQWCIDRIGTPREILAKSATHEWDDETLALRAELKEDELSSRKKPKAEGRKDDGAKVPYHLLAPEYLDATAQVLAFGAKKYDARNWEHGMDWSRPFSALMRHMWAWWRGEAKDPETGMSHLWHASCCIMFLVAYEQRNVGNDDRPHNF